MLAAAETPTVNKFVFPEPSMELAAKDFVAPPEAEGPPDAELETIARELDTAALDPKHWVDLLKRLARLFDATCAHVALYDFESGRVLLHAIASEQFEIPYPVLEAYEQVAPFDPRARLAVCFPGRTMTHEDIDPALLAELPVVKMAPDELAQMMTLTDVDKPFFGFLSLLRHRNDPVFSRAERVRMTSLATALNRSMKLFRATELQAREGRRIQLDLLEQLSFPAGLFTADGVCLGLNPAGRDRLGINSPGAWPSPFGWSSSCREAAQIGMLEVTVDTPTGPACGRLARLDGVHPLMLFEIDVDTTSATVRADRFSVHYGLSHAERAVLHLLASGQPLADIAEERGTTQETVRAQLRSVREKTGVHTQRELISAIMSFEGGTP